jgi:hypothetical protein
MLYVINNALALSGLNANQRLAHTDMYPVPEDNIKNWPSEVFRVSLSFVEVCPYMYG